jgi:hypothetical protein
MTELDYAMEEHMIDLVYVEHRPFSYKDFLYFKVNEKPYKMAPGTFRNKISKMIQYSKVEVHTKSNPNFYTLKGCRFDNRKSMTGNHTEVINIQRLIRHPIYQILDESPFDERAVHNLHLSFKTKRIYDILLNNPDLKTESNKKYEKSKGLSFIYSDIDKFIIIITIYPNDTCTIIFGCSEAPIILDFEGINRLTIALCRIEERLSQLLINSSIKLPNYKNWTITLWHIGKDSISEYSKEMFHCEWELAEKIAIRIYSKEFQDKKRKIRIELQQNPSISIEELKNAILEKILK